MRIEMKHEAEMEKRKGLTGRTILAVIWLVASYAVSYLIVSWLFAQGYLTLDSLYQNLGIPGNMSEGAVTLGIAFVIFLAIQFVVLIAYAVTSPGAKRRPGVPRLESDDPDPYAKTIDYH
jgi:hypothetical protein